MTARFLILSDGDTAALVRGHDPIGELIDVFQTQDAARSHAEALADGRVVHILYRDVDDTP